MKSGRVVVCGIEGSAADAATVEVAAREYGVPEWTLEEARTTLELTADALRGRVPVECHLPEVEPVPELADAWFDE